jgi:hypothetical protein
MQFFEETEDTAERVGKVLGTVIAALVYLAVIGLIWGATFRRGCFSHHSFSPTT